MSLDDVQAKSSPIISGLISLHAFRSCTPCCFAGYCECPPHPGDDWPVESWERTGGTLNRLVRRLFEGCSKVVREMKRLHSDREQFDWSRELSCFRFLRSEKRGRSFCPARWKDDVLDPNLRDYVKQCSLLNLFIYLALLVIICSANFAALSAHLFIQFTCKLSAGGLLNAMGRASMEHYALGTDSVLQNGGECP